MVKFKIYDKKLKKFVNLTSSPKVWDIRYDLGIWNDSIGETKLKDMYKIMKKHDKHLELQIKTQGKFRPISNELLKSIDSEYKNNKHKRVSQARLLKEYWKIKDLETCSNHENDIKILKTKMKNIHKDSRKKKILDRRMKNMTKRNERCKKIKDKFNHLLNKKEYPELWEFIKTREIEICKKRTIPELNKLKSKNLKLKFKHRISDTLTNKVKKCNKLIKK